CSSRSPASARCRPAGSWRSSTSARAAACAASAATSARGCSATRRSAGAPDLGVLLVLSGPSGAGKGTIGKELVARDPKLWFSVSWNTRPPRPGERDGVEYHFVSRDDFLASRRAGGFLESFEVYGDL